jgi:hypothetical protein
MNGEMTMGAVSRQSARLKRQDFPLPEGLTQRQKKA